MSTLRERLEGLVAKWRKIAEDCPPEHRAKWQHVFEATGTCADELAAALIAEGQGAQVSAEMLMDAVAMVDDEGLWKFDQPKWYEAMAEALQHLSNSTEEIKRLRAAAPSLHKEGPLATDLDDIRLLATIDAERKVLLKGAELLRDAIGAFENNNAIDWAEFAGTANKLEAIATVALHKEGAGGEPPVVCNVCHALLEIADGEHVCGLTAAEAYSLGWQRGHNAASPPLPLQRTLPDEQFKGVVVEAIGAESGQWALGQELSDSIGAYAVALARRQDGESANDEEIGAEIKRCVAAKRAWDASPAGRAEQEPK